MLDASVRELARAKNYATVTTLFADGSPQTSLVWIDAYDEHLLFNTEIHRQKYRNLTGDPRVSVLIMETANPYHYAEVRGRMISEVRGERARAHIDELSEKYAGGPYANPIQSERVIIEIEPTHVVVR